MIRTLIADDHEMFRELLRLAIRTQPDLEIVGEAGDGRSTLDLVERLRPDVVLLDYKMPQVRSFAGLVQDIHRAWANTRVIVLSGFSDAEIAEGATRGGASGYVLKATRLHSVFDAIRAVASGGIWVDPGLPRRIFDLFQAGSVEASGQNDGMSALTRREREVLSCVARGQSNRDIAVKLCVSEQTVKTHLTRIFAKLDVENRVEAALAFYGRDAESASHSADS
jgi:DNA-binding NarL/FixJ family response regulator